MAVKFLKLGKLVVDCGDVVCFSMDSVIGLAEECGYDITKLQEFIKRWKGVECDLRSDGIYTVDRVTAVDQEGSTYSAIIIGADVPEIKRFLLTNEEEFSDFYKRHPKAVEVRKGKSFNRDLFSEINDEYVGAIMKNPTNLQAEPTKRKDGANFDAEHTATTDKKNLQVELDKHIKGGS